MVLQRCPRAVTSILHAPRLTIQTRQLVRRHHVQVAAKEQEQEEAGRNSSLRTALASLPKTQYKLHFRSLPFTDAAYLLIGSNPGLAKSGATKPAREATGRAGSARSAIIWSCEYFSIRCVPPLERHLARNNREFVPFPRPEKSTATRDFVTPSKALDRVLLKDQDVPQECKKEVEQWTKKASYKMDLTIVIPKRVGKLSTTRTRTRTRIRSAIRQIVQYGITTRESERVVQQKIGPAHWLLPGWIYIFHPSLEVLLLPQEILLNKVAAGLRAIKDKGIEARTAYRAERDLKVAEEQVELSSGKADGEEAEKATHAGPAPP